MGSYHIIYGSYLRDRVRTQASKCHYNSMNMLSMYALMGAYTPEGRVWVDELRTVLNENIQDAYHIIDERFDGITTTHPEGTYMLFLDASEWCAKHSCDVGELLRRGWQVGVGWQDGRPFHGPCHIRMNLASPHSRVMEAFRRLEEHLFSA